MFYWIAAGLIGWCGTGWPIRFPFGGGGGGVEPGDWPPNCWVCGQLIGALAAIVLYAIFGREMAEIGFTGFAIVSFAAGSVANKLVGGLVAQVRGAPTVQTTFG